MAAEVGLALWVDVLAPSHLLRAVAFGRECHLWFDFDPSIQLGIHHLLPLARVHQQPPPAAYSPAPRETPFAHGAPP